MTPDKTRQASDPDIFSSEFLLGNVGAPFLIGMAVGFFAKKSLKIAVLVGGAILVILFLAESWNLVTVKDGALIDAASRAAETIQKTGTLLTDRMHVISARGGSAVVGFLAGFKAG